MINDLLIAFELHSPSQIKEAFTNGISPNEILNGQPLINSLIDMYARGPRFKECIKVFVDNGLVFDDKALLAVLLDDAEMLNKLLLDDKSSITKTYSFNSTFTPLLEASLLHICAEYNHTKCASILVNHGADINAKSGIDDNGFGAQTPIFHTVNQDANKSLDMLKFLLAQNANLDITVKGLIWGKGYDWETFIPSVNPISYAMMGLLRQFQRTEKDIYEVVQLLMKAEYGIEFSPRNIPNKYLIG
jgi:Ankyrin repeats (many copies)